VSDAAPNFRVAVRFDGVEDDDATVTTLRDFLESNEAAPDVCERVKALQPGEVARFGGGAAPEVEVRRLVVSPPRYTRIRVPIDLKEFRGSQSATVTIDRKRLTMSIRPLRRRTVVELSLSALAESYLAKQMRLDVLAKRKARRARR
jgi:hypothetical protein